MKCLLLLIVSLLTLGTSGLAAAITIGASKDNTLFQDPAGALSNGAGEFFFVGRIGPNGGSLLRRGVIAFDIASALPAESIIESVTLDLHLSNANLGVPQAAISLHTLLSDWGEGSSDAGNPGGGGALATPGDATWVHRSFSATTWNSAGGDFAPASSATRSVGGIAFYSFSSAQMAADVQSWVTSPATNFGWILLGGESQLNSARRFDTREHPIEDNRPALTIIYTPVPEPATAFLAACGLTLLLRRSVARARAV